MTSLPIELDRMALDEVGYRPQDLAREIRCQLGAPTGYIDIESVAYALDIVEIKSTPLTTFEGALLTDPERSRGSILINATNGQLRGRFTIAHELLHFLNDRHVQTEDGFRCRGSDIGHRNVPAKPGMSRHLRQEMEANQFAIELLGPKGNFAPHLEGDPDLEHIHDLAIRLKLSKEATARRYVELHDALIAMVFFQGGTVRYFDKSGDFPFLMAKKDSLLPPSVQAHRSAGTLTDAAEADPKDWLDGPIKGELWIQTLYQRNGFGITMLTLDAEDPGAEDTDDGDPEDAYRRYSR